MCETFSRTTVTRSRFHNLGESTYDSHEGNPLTKLPIDNYLSRNSTTDSSSIFRSNYTNRCSLILEIKKSTLSLLCTPLFFFFNRKCFSVSVLVKREKIISGAGKVISIHGSILISSDFLHLKAEARKRRLGWKRVGKEKEKRERVTLWQSRNGSLRGDRGSLSRGRVQSSLSVRPDKKRKRSRPTPDARSFVIFNYGRVRGEDRVATLDQRRSSFLS